MHSRKINRRELIGAMGAAASAAVAIRMRQLSDQPDVDLDDHDDDHRHELGVRDHAKRDSRPVSVSDRSVPQRYPRR